MGKVFFTVPLKIFLNVYMVIKQQQNGCLFFPLRRRVGRGEGGNKITYLLIKNLKHNLQGPPKKGIFRNTYFSKTNLNHRWC